MVEERIVADAPVQADVTVDKLKIKVRKLPKALAAGSEGMRMVRIKVKFQVTSSAFAGVVAGKLKLTTIGFDAAQVGDIAESALVVGRDGSGRISAGGDIDCAPDCGEWYPGNPIVVLSAKKLRHSTPTAMSFPSKPPVMVRTEPS